MVRIQSIGMCEGTPAKELKVGDKLLWNFGYISEVIEITKTTNESIFTILKCEDGKLYPRRFLKTREVVIHNT